LIIVIAVLATEVPAGREMERKLLAHFHAVPRCATFVAQVGLALKADEILAGLPIFVDAIDAVSAFSS